MLLCKRKRHRLTLPTNSHINIPKLDTYLLVLKRMTQNFKRKRKVSSKTRCLMVYSKTLKTQWRISFLLTTFLKKQFKGSKHGAEISLMNFEQDEATVASTGAMKSEKGASTGVNLRFHTLAEYTNLTHLQRRELKVWHVTPEGRAAVKASKA